MAQGCYAYHIVEIQRQTNLSSVAEHVAFPLEFIAKEFRLWAFLGLLGSLRKPSRPRTYVLGSLGMANDQDGAASSLTQSTGHCQSLYYLTAMMKGASSVAVDNQRVNKLKVRHIGGLQYIRSWLQSYADVGWPRSRVLAWSQPSPVSILRTVRQSSGFRISTHLSGPGTSQRQKLVTASRRQCLDVVVCSWGTYRTIR